MRLKNLMTHVEIRSEYPSETRDLLFASMQPYCPRSAGTTIDDCRQISITYDEAEAFRDGILRDDKIASPTKWSICKLIACWLSGEIKDEASAW